MVDGIDAAEGDDCNMLVEESGVTGEGNEESSVRNEYVGGTTGGPEVRTVALASDLPEATVETDPFRGGMANGIGATAELGDS